MERHGEEVHVSTDEARSGSTPHVVRYVLGFSTLLVIALLSGIWIIGAINAPQDQPGDGITNQAPPTPAE
ncbi:MAG: hypothetical protein R3E09_05745 [Novosphingobium sp.]|nr:hypothetical protein [Novosphingobium sp.]